MNTLRDLEPAQRLHHLGFVVADIQSSMQGFVRSLAATWDGQVFEDPVQKAKVAFLATRPDDPLIELVEPTVEGAPTWRFLNEKGGGLHHVCYEVDDLEARLAEMRARRCIVVRQPTPAVAFKGRRIAWTFTPESLLVELLERGDLNLP
jgi:methylmalonyl-CoA/ethylmalonyl-CoA epimerase